MMSNVKLSAAELAMACNPDILLTKNNVIQKVYHLFGQLSDRYTLAIKDFNLPETVVATSPRISRGENYLGLPWVMLDYPRFFSKEEIFSIRTMFWWGRHFSQFLILKGNVLTPIISERVATMSLENDWHICNNPDAWQHHFNSNNMIALGALRATQISGILQDCGFLKLGTKIPIEAWESVENSMEDNFKKFLLFGT